MTRKRTMVSFLAITAIALLTSLAFSVAPAPKPWADVSLVNGTSVLVGAIPEIKASENKAVYEYTIYNGGSIVDQVPLTITLTDDSSRLAVPINWASFKVQIGNDGAGGNLPGVTLPADVTITPGFSSSTVNISISTGPLILADPTVAEGYKKNISISFNDKDPNNLDVNCDSPKKIEICVDVRPAPTNSISCYTTDSNGFFLADCSGAAVNQSASDDGRFAIVTNNKGIETATNPGQFCYNVLFLNNTGGDQTLSVNFERTGVMPHGTQAIHASVFPPEFSGVTVEGFSFVNDAIPGGHDDGIEDIFVPAGWTLWVTYHLEWEGLGKPLPLGTQNVCSSANQEFSVMATVSGTGISESCASGAWGYAKK